METTEATNTPATKWDKATLAVVGVTAALLALTAWWLLFPWGAPKRLLGLKEQWALQPNERTWSLPLWITPLGVLLLCGGFALLCAYDRFKRAKNEKEQRASTKLSLGGVVLLSLLWPWALLGPGGTENLIYSTWSDTANGYFATAYQVNSARELTTEYSKWQQPPSPVQAHVATHPPGAVLFYYGARKSLEAWPAFDEQWTRWAEGLTALSRGELVRGATEMRGVAARSANVSEVAPLPQNAIGGALWSAFLLSVLVALTAPAVFLIARGNETDTAIADRRGLFAAALWALAPAPNLFTFTLDAFIAACVAWTLLLWLRHLQTGSRAAVVGAGILCALTSFVSFGTLAIGLVIIGLVAWNIWKNQFSRKDAVTSLLIFGLSFVAVWIVLAVMYGFSPLAVFLRAMEVHKNATVAVRSYTLWLWLNFVMFLPFCGWTVAVASWGFATHLREAKINWPAVLGAIVWQMLIFLSLSGNVRGEVERLWLFAVPALCVAASTWNFKPKVALALLGLQTVQTLLMAATLAPLVRPF
jgi:hypothetical protein